MFLLVMRRPPPSKRSCYMPQMPKHSQPRIPRSKDELKSELTDQLHLLLDACERYDAGFELAGKQIAVTLRILLHEHRQSQSLLGQLKIRSQNPFLDTSGEIRESNLLSEIKLLTWGMRQREGQLLELILVPQCLGGVTLPSRWVQFPVWWSQPVVRDSNRNYFSRLDLVSAVANTDGGAHVDPGTPENYHRFKVGTIKAMSAVSPDGTTTFAEGRPELACMRQIAHEVILTLQRLKGLEHLLEYAPRSRWEPDLAHHTSNTAPFT